MKKIGIIGGGFSATMTAVQLINKSAEACEIILINERETLNRGFAYNPYSDKLLLNVITGKMSAYPYNSGHFLDWVMCRQDFKDKDRTLIANSFLPRRLYGEYLCAVWEEAKITAESKHIKVSVIEGFVARLEVTEKAVSLQMNDDSNLGVDYCVIATGNQIPRNPEIKNGDFYTSRNYFQNPWKSESVKELRSGLPVLIVGNGLSMVDTVLGLMEQGFKGKIYSVSPNGFKLLPHRHNGMVYSKLVEELRDDLSLYELLKLVNRHIKTVREYGVSAEPVIDSLRPHSQKIWKSLSEKEKAQFMSRLRHLWGLARHRIPLHIQEKIQQLRIDGSLEIISGKITGFRETEDAVIAEYYDKKASQPKTLLVSRVINCSGPETDLLKAGTGFLKSCLLSGILSQDSLKLGIKTETETFRVLDPAEKQHSKLFTIGSNLKGELWESIAVNELRAQAEKLAEILIVASAQ